MCLSSGCTEHDPGEMGPAGVAGVEHQRRALQRRRHRRDRRRQQPQHQPGHQVRLLLQRRHRLPHHQTVRILSTCADPAAHQVFDIMPTRGHEWPWCCWGLGLHTWKWNCLILVPSNPSLQTPMFGLFFFPEITIFRIQGALANRFLCVYSGECSRWTLLVKYLRSCRISLIWITCMASKLSLLCFEDKAVKHYFFWELASRM